MLGFFAGGRLCSRRSIKAGQQIMTSIDIFPSIWRCRWRCPHPKTWRKPWEPKTGLRPQKLHPVAETAWPLWICSPHVFREVRNGNLPRPRLGNSYTRNSRCLMVFHVFDVFWWFLMILDDFGWFWMIFDDSWCLFFQLQSVASDVKAFFTKPGLQILYRGSSGSGWRWSETTWPRRPRRVSDFFTDLGVS